MLRSSPCSVFWVDDLVRRHSSDCGAVSAKQQTTMIQSELLQNLGASRSSSGGSNPSRRFYSFSLPHTRAGWTFCSRSVWKEGFAGGLGSPKGRQFVGGAGLRICGKQELKEEAFGLRGSGLSRIEASGTKGASDDRDISKEKDMGSMRLLDRIPLGQGGKSGDGVVEVQIERLDNNSRKIVAKITIEAPLDNVWAILTDYEHLAEFIPGLAVSQLLEKRHNGARLYQVGEQDLALGFKFKAKAIVDCEEKPTTVHQNYIRRDIDFETVEGDFQVFRGTWRMEQPVRKFRETFPTVAGGVGKELITLLSYILVVQPKIWLPVALLEGRLTSEVKTNLVSIRERSIQPSGS